MKINKINYIIKIYNRWLKKTNYHKLSILTLNKTIIYVKKLNNDKPKY
jgi:hypothetical protein